LSSRYQPVCIEEAALSAIAMISQDGHPIAGSVVFSIGAPTATALSANADAGIDSLIWLARFALYFGLFVGIGGVFFLRWIAPALAAAKAVIAMLSVGVLGAAASLGLQGLNVLGQPLRDAAAWAPRKIALSTSLGLRF
jgi:copper transport protein